MSVFNLVQLGTFAYINTTYKDHTCILHAWACAAWVTGPPTTSPEGPARTAEIQLNRLRTAAIDD